MQDIHFPIRHLCTLLIALAFTMDCNAQNEDPFAAYEAFKKQVQQSYSNFRDQCLKDYAEFVRKAWDAFEGKAPIPVPQDDMLPPVVKPKDEKTKPTQKPIDIDEVIEPPTIPQQPEPIEPIKAEPKLSDEYLSFTFFGTGAKVRYDSSRAVALRKADEKAVADALLLLGDGRCDNMLYDCLELRRQHNLCDWAYLMMLKSLAETMHGKGSNEAVLLMAYLYMQSGYTMRLAEDKGKLYMMFASDSYIYNSVGYKLDGLSFFGVENLPERLNICRASFPKERSMSLIVSGEQLLDNDMTEIRARQSERYPNVKASTAVNRNWLDFCSSYPTSQMGDNVMTRWAMYANTPLSQSVRQQLYPQLQETIAGKSQLEAANILLNWVQTGFEYEYDNKVWGHDRAFFAEESLYYPYCDCEDRSILFTRLVRDLLGLKCILVFYPGHLAAAVRFTDQVNGDFIMLNGYKYIVSDPTYIGAPVGITMPDMDNQTAKVILLD